MLRSWTPVKSVCKYEIVTIAYNSNYYKTSELNVLHIIQYISLGMAYNPLQIVANVLELPQTQKEIPDTKLIQEFLLHCWHHHHDFESLRY